MCVGLATFLDFKIYKACVHGILTLLLLVMLNSVARESIIMQLTDFLNVIATCSKDAYDYTQ